MHPLLQEIVNQTTPERFMNPYNAKKVSMAAQLNKQAYSTNIRNVEKVLSLIEDSTSILGCKYSAEQVYDYLFSICKPTAIENKKDFDRFNSLCQRLYENKEDISMMTSIVKEEMALYNEKMKKEYDEEPKNLIFRIVIFLVVIFSVMGILLLSASFR